MRCLLVSFFIVLSTSTTLIAQITILNHDAEVWGRDQVVDGKLDSIYSSSGILRLNSREIAFSVESGDSSFSVPVKLDEGVNRMTVQVDSIFSRTLSLTLGYKIRPEIFAYARAAGRSIDLIAHIIANPDSMLPAFKWSADPDNPYPLSIRNEMDALAYSSIPESAPDGEYYFDLEITRVTGEKVRARTYVTCGQGEVVPFNMKTDHAAWIDSAVIYQITPYNFVPNGDYYAITAKLSELRDLGINTIYLQPVYQTYYYGQGYDITNYFKLRQDYGPESALRSLISRAKELGMRVLFDFVANHSSIRHPYAVHSSQNGSNSHYYDYYQRNLDNAPYAMHYTRYSGFINYFWNELPNLNYNNPEVRRWISEACVYWVENFDIDGYRFDAIWGVNARRPEFMQDLRVRLKTIKPEILLLGEDKATWPASFDERFDAAYDWMPEESWVSHWSWQYDYNPNANPTVFLHPSKSSRAGMLDAALTNNGNGFHERAIVLRFMENNDTQRFILHHGADRTKMAATMLFALDGIPMMYQGQEIGFNTHPYQTNGVFLTNQSIASLDTRGLIPFYKKLIRIRRENPELASGNRTRMQISPGGTVYAFRRWSKDHNSFVVLNMGDTQVSATLQIPYQELGLDTMMTWYLTDLIGGTWHRGSLPELSQVYLDLQPYSTQILHLGEVPLDIEYLATDNAVKPGIFELQQNYPNPFNPETTIPFLLPERGNIILKIFDILGRQVARQEEHALAGGPHEIRFDGSRLASGVYFYSLQFGGKELRKKMILLR